jgi:DNA polymerase elongation subunit (family B)
MEDTKLSEEFRLISFHTFDRMATDASINEEEEDAEGMQAKKPAKEFIVQMFGINEKGQTASIFVEGYLPFFYAKVDDKWNDGHRIGFIKQIKTYGLNETDDSVESSIVSSELIKRKKLYGFDGEKSHTFILIRFRNEAAMKKAKGLWYDTTFSETGEYKRLLKPDGYVYDKVGTILYEAQIPPLLRLFHIKEISPSGWIALPIQKRRLSKVKRTSCHFEFTIKFADIISLPKKETRVPYKICSFDIEASSSHGDFPLPVKNYKKLATNITDLFINRDEKEKEDIAENTAFIREIILFAFGFASAEKEKKMKDNVDKVFPIDPKKITKEKIDILFDEWIKICPAQYKNSESAEIDKLLSSITDIEGSGGGGDDDGEDGEESEGDEGCAEEPAAPQWWNAKNKAKPYKKKGTIIELLKDPEVTRDTQIVELTRTLTTLFPKLQGDNVTFIGSTFLRYGEEKPYLNHCIALNTCTKVKGAVIESYKTEKEVLLAWTKIIQKEDPDIIIGYNIFGFDYQFMYLRAKELNCERAFLQLSRNKHEVCLNKDWRTGKEGLEENTIVIASGQHDLKFVKMTGRLQIDLYNYFRRDYQLSQYKLDYVSGYFIGDQIKKIEHIGGNTKITSKNLTGLENGSFVNFEEEAHSVDSYKNGKKFEVSDVDAKNGTFMIQGEEMPDMVTKKVRWGMAKDDVTPQDIFRMTNEGANERAVIAKYCIQDCNLVHHLMRKIDVITGYIEMANLCSVPLDFLVMRGQSIKLTSYIAKKCREKNTLMPVIDKGDMDEGYEGATVLEPKCNLYLDDPVACLDYGSLYPSSMISENISHDSKVLTKEYDLQDNLLCESGEKDLKTGEYIYDNLPGGYKYVDIQYDTFKWQHKNGNPKAGMEKVKVGYKICRFAQYPDGKKGIMPAILEELLTARKTTRKLIPEQKDDFMKNILDKRQLSIKVTANSLYGQTGAKTSSFYEKDCAASTTAIGRKLLHYAKRVIEEAYADQLLETAQHGQVKTNAEYVYGDTDSVFFKFNLKDVNGKPIIGQKALEITIELAQQAGELATKFLKGPHDLEYEKTFLPFCLLSKKRYVGMLYETDPSPAKCKRKSMGIVLKRRDNAPIVKDIYGGVIDILMKEKNVEQAAEFLKKCLQNMVDEKYEMDKLVITKSLRSGYKNPNQIAHKVLADRIGKRDAGNKPNIGDRIPYIYIDNPDKKALQGERIETPEYIVAHKVKINYAFYITNQIMKPLQQVFALVLEDMKDFRKAKGFTLRSWISKLEALKVECGSDKEKYKKKEDALRNKEVKALLFDAYLRKTNNVRNGYQAITDFFGKQQ